MIPSSLPSPGGTGAGPGLVDQAGRYRGPDVHAAVARRRERLRRRGIRPGHRVLLHGENCAGYIITLLALAQLDTSVILVDHCQPAADVRAAALQARAQWLVHRADHPLPIPELTPVPYPADFAVDAAPSDSSTGELENWWQRADAVIMWSSGTTGVPKGVVKSGQAVLANSLATQAVMRYRPDDVLVPWLPFSHQYGMSLVLLWWLTGATLVVTAYRRLARAVGDAIAAGATVIDAPPSTYHTLLSITRRRPELASGLSTVRYWGVGGAPLPTPLYDEFQDQFGQPLLDGYGLTEIGNVALATRDNPAGCGRPLPGVTVRVVGAKDAPLSPEEPGEILVRSSGLMTGYLGPEGEPTPAPTTSWYNTNDLGYFDENGNLHVLGRRQAVHRHGHTLYPESIARRAEQVCGLPVTVVPIDDVRRGSSLVFVICDPAGGSPQRWRELLNQRLPHYELPNQVQVRSELPLTPTGKVDLPRLRKEVTAAAS